MNERELLERALEVLRSEGAEGDVYLEHRQNLRLQVRDGDREGITRAEIRGLAVRAIKDNRLGFVHTADTRPDRVAEAAREAVSLSRVASRRDDLMLAPAAGPCDGHDEGEPQRLYDSSIEKRCIDEKQEWISAAEAAARDYDRRIRRTESAAYDENLAARWLVNTNGLFRHYRKTWISTSVEVAAEDAGDMQTGQKSADVMRWEDLPDPDELGTRAGEQGVRLLGGRPVETGHFPVLFAPDMGWPLLLYVALALRGDHLSRGRSWLLDRQGAVIGSPIVTVRDNGRHPLGVNSLPFDGEGVETQDLVLLDKGKVKGRLFDLASGKRMNAPSTGSSRRDSYDQLPQISTHNLYLEPGESSPDELLSGIERGLWVWGLSGWWIGLDPSNPQFSSAASGLWVEKGKPVRPVARVSLGGSLEEILGNVTAVANDLKWHGSGVTPSFLVSSMAVSGT